MLEELLRMGHQWPMVITMEKADDQAQTVINVEETIGKAVGKRKSRTAAEQAQRIQRRGQRIYRHRGFRVCPKGVFRFHTHEEADEWMRQASIRRATTDAS